MAAVADSPSITLAPEAKGDADTSELMIDPQAKDSAPPAPAPLRKVGVAAIKTE